MMNQKLVQPEALVSLGRIPGLTEIAAEEAEVRIGAMVRHAHAARDSRVRAAAPVLARTLSVVGNAQVRASATVPCFVLPIESTGYSSSSAWQRVQLRINTGATSAA